MSSPTPRARQNSIASRRSTGSTQTMQGSQGSRRVTYESVSTTSQQVKLDEQLASQASRPTSRASRRSAEGSALLASTGATNYQNSPEFEGDLERTIHSISIENQGRDEGSRTGRTSRASANGRMSRARSSSRDSLLAHIKQAPSDKYKLVCFGFTILGITTLLPWNFFITATDYWMYKFRNVSSAYDTEQAHLNERTPLQVFFESYLAIAANVPMLLSILVNSLYAARFSQKKRLYVSLSVMLTVFTLTTVFVKIDTDQMQSGFFVVTMVLVVIISFFSATFQAAIFGIVANFPSNCMHAMVNGQAVAGLLAVTIQIVSMLNNTGPIMSGMWYFLASTIFLAFAILCYWLMDNDYSRHYLLRIPDEDELSTSLSVRLVENRWELLEALEDCWQMAASVVLAFWASLSVFPGVCVLVLPQHPNTSFLTGRFFVPISTFLLFNFGDLTGRMCSSYLAFPAHRKNGLLGLCIARSFVPLLVLFCNVQPRYHTPVLFHNDIYLPILVSLTAFTNGYIFSSAMLMAARESHRTRLEMTGFVMAGALGIGLTLGSVSSTILLRLV